MKKTMKEVIEQRNRWIETAKNLNALDADSRKNIVKHIKSKYAIVLIPSMIDRLDELAAGYGCDQQLTGYLEQAGITL